MIAVKSPVGLIGYTGFVGGTLLKGMRFDKLYNSSNIGEIAGQKFDLLVCAGVSANKWIANRDPVSDRARIANLTDALANVTARDFILISTIDVYPDTNAPLDEDWPIDPTLNHDYGRNRYELERWVADRFPDARIIRLAALFGEGLRKNALYDLLRRNQVEKLNRAAVYQWYPLRRFMSDLETIRSSADLKLVNLFSAPVRMADIIDAFFPGAPVDEDAAHAPRYSLRTKYAEFFGGHQGYVLDAGAVLGEMARFVASERRRQVMQLLSHTTIKESG